MDSISSANFLRSERKNNFIQEENIPNLTIREGWISQTKETVKIKRNNRVIAKVRLGKPVMVAQANKEEEWGFFQFPVIGKAKDGTLIVTWHMKEDSHKAYGTEGRKYTPMMSKDAGKTWQPVDKGYFAPARAYNGLMRDGCLLQILTPPSKEIREYTAFPKAVATAGSYSFYKHDELPEDMQGVYLQYLKENTPPKIIHAKIEDPWLLRNTIGESMPLVWWGNIIQMEDGSLLAGVYPCRYMDENGEVTRSSVSFYQSNDGGNSWKVKGKILCHPDGILNKRGDNEFDEPRFEVLADSTLICVMRTGSTSPLYKTFSTDKGENWSRPVPFTPNGVDPQVMLLGNGVLVLVSGRPGVQVRFSLDGTGMFWTFPIDMLPFIKADGTFSCDVSCGYTSLLEADDNSFYMVYSNFMMQNEKGERRKSIMFRKIEVKKVNRSVKYGDM